MSNIVLIISLLMLIITRKKRYYYPMVLCLIISISSLLDEKYYFLLFGFITLVILYDLIQNNENIKRNHFLFIMIIPFFLLFQSIFIHITYQQNILSIFRYLILPFIAYAQILYLKRYEVKYSTVFLPYFIINLGVLYYRAVVDYSFMGYVETYKGTIYESLYTFGGSGYRPSNLNSPIIFSIELVIFIYLLYLENKDKKKYFIFFLVLAIPALYLMSSRSSYVLITFFVLYQLIQEKRYKAFFILTVLSLVLLISDVKDIRFFSFLDYQNGSYGIRFDSVVTTIKKFALESTANILLGKGAGTANLFLGSGKNLIYYTENFHISVLVDEGVIGFLFWIFVNAYCVFLSFKKRRQYLGIIIIGLLLINFMSSNLTSYTIQFIYYALLFEIIYSDTLYETEIREKIEGSIL